MIACRGSASSTRAPAAPAAPAAPPLGLRSRGRLSTAGVPSLTSDGEASAAGEAGIQLVATSNAALPRRAAGTGEPVAAGLASAWAEIVLWAGIWAEIATSRSRSRRKAGSAPRSALRSALCAALCAASASSGERAASGGGKRSSLALGGGRDEGVRAGVRGEGRDERGVRAEVRVRGGARQEGCDGEGKGVRVAVGRAGGDGGEAAPPALRVWSAWQQEHAR